MTPLPLEDKDRILAHIRAIRIYLRVSDHDPRLVVQKLSECLEEERLYDAHICLGCKRPWAFHPQDANGNYHCFLATAPFPDPEGYRQVIP